MYTFAKFEKTATQPRLKLALIGLGRLGAIRARILAFQQPRTELVAACETKPGGSLGEIHVVETTCLNQQDPTVTFSAQSGGIFVDMGVHDINIGRYYLDVKSGPKNPKKQINRVAAMVQQAVYGGLAKYGDCDNGWAMVEFAKREGPHSVVRGISAINRVEVRVAHGVRTATTPDAFGLYDRSFLNDLSEFAAAVLDGAPLACTRDDAYEAAKIATALQYSFRDGVPVYSDEEGLPIMEKPNAKKL
ncbi:putative nad binding rossmann fold oxidoreductase [Diaporthe ampelina]|uniref:Putative nad binding rossmann fold oxidoreductase n=1 Tax=Diaporthe ampelina TaxID=1214573 RepID=A0A0G2HZM4_9PEZI|nr:putative nad binding rossmann fold oxidoreductase [Diaporthe ampelina]